MKTSGKWHRHVRCFALGIVAAAVCGEGVADVMPLPKTEHNLAAFFRFDTESAWGADAGPNGSSLSAKSGNAAYLAADGCLASGALNLPYAAKTTSSAGNTYTSSTVSGTFGSAEVVPDLSSMTKGWTLAFWFKADPEMMDQKIHSKASFRTILEQFAKAGVTDNDLNVFAAIVTNGVWNHIAVAFNPERYAAGKDAYSLFVNCGGVGGTGNRVDGSFPEGGTASCPLYLPVAISGTSLTLGGDFGLKFATPRDLGSYGKLNELKLTLQGTVDDIACVNRNLTTNEITRLASTGETYVFLTKSTASFENYPYWSSQWGYMKPVPHVGSDYLVDSGFTLSTSNLTSYTASFGGDSLTLGRFGGTAGNLKIQSTTADVTVGDLRANNGKIQVVSSTATLRGAVSVNGTDASPFAVETAGNNATRLTWKSSLSGAAGSCLKVAAGGGKGALDVTFDCDATGFRGTILADGASTTLRVSRATLQSMGAASRPNAIKLTNGAKLASFGDEGLVFETSATSGKFSEVAWTPATPVGGAGVELVFTGANFSLENDIEDLAFSKLNFAAKGTIRGKRLKATAAAAGHDAILYFGAQGAAITAPLYLADNLTVTNNLNPTIGGYTKINGVDGDISGPGRLTFWCAHRLHAQGYISLFGRNTFSGGLDVQLGNVVPTNVVALGTGKVYCTNETASVQGAANYARLWLRNFAGVEYTQTLTNEVFVGPQLVNVGNTARFQTDGNFTFTDAAVLHAVGSNAKINGYGKWTLKKGLDAIDSWRVVWETGGSDNNISETPLNMPTTILLAGHQLASNQSAIRFKVAGNRVGSLSAYLNAVFAFDVDNAFSVAPDLEPMNDQKGMIIELNGTTQTFGSHVDGSSHAPLLIRNSNANKSATVTLTQNTANRNSSLTISGPMTFVKDGTSTLTTTKGFWVNGDLVVRNGMLQLYGAVSNHLAKTVSVEGGELDLGGGLFTCGKLQLKGGRISNGTLVCTECAEIEAGESTAEIIGTVVKKGAGAASVYTARRAARGGDGLPSGTVFYMAFDDPDNIGKVTVGGADLRAEKEKNPSYQAAGVFGGCAYFDGANTALSSKNVGYPTGLPKGAEPYTVSAWICVSNGCDAAGGWIAYGKSGAKGLGNNFRLTSGGNDIWNYWYAMDVGCPATGIRDGQWHHVVGTFDGTTRKIYYDGALGVSDSTMTPNIGTDLLLVGRTLNSVYLKGCIDEVLILNRAATDAEVRGLFLRGAESVRNAVSVANGTVKASTLTAKGASLYYPLSSEADLLKDFSGNGKNLTKGGTGTVSFSTDSPFGTGGSASFDGKSYLRHNSFPEGFPTGAASYTVCMFVKAANSSVINGCFVGYGENVKYHANHFRLDAATARLCNYWAGEGFFTDFKDGGTFKDGHWHSVVGTYDSATGKRVNYIDGGQTVGTQQPSYKPIIDAKNFTIGCDSYRQTEWFTGKIAEVAVFPRVLTAAEVAQYHAAGLSGGGLRVTGTYQPGGTVDGNLVLADGVTVVGGAQQVVTGDVLVEGAGEYVPPSVGEAVWDFIDFGGELLGDSAENLKEWTVQGLATGYVKGRKNKLRAYAYTPGLLLLFK